MRIAPLTVKHHIFFALLALTTSLSYSQERRSAPAVPADMLIGQRLVDREAGFSIEAPARWIWLSLPSESASFKNYAASNPNGRPGYAVNVATAKFAWTPQNARDVQVGMAKKLRSMGFTVEPRTFEVTNIPAEDSYRFQWKVVLPSGATMYRFGYELKTGDKILSFTCFADTPTEPASFAAFVRSFRIEQR